MIKVFIHCVLLFELNFHAQIPIPLTLSGYFQGTHTTNTTEGKLTSGIVLYFDSELKIFHEAGSIQGDQTICIGRYSYHADSALIRFYDVQCTDPSSYQTRLLGEFQFVSDDQQIFLTNPEQKVEIKLTRMELKNLPPCTDQVPYSENCSAYFERWFFYAATNSCKKIAYSGCTERGFASREECEQCQ